MSVLRQPCFRWIGSTNSVQPYCRLATATIAAMPAHSCSQRLRSGEAGEESSCIGVVQRSTGTLAADAVPKFPLVSPALTIRKIFPGERFGSLLGQQLIEESGELDDPAGEMVVEV